MLQAQNVAWLLVKHESWKPGQKMSSTAKSRVVMPAVTLMLRCARGCQHWERLFSSSSSSGFITWIFQYCTPHKAMVLVSRGHGSSQSGLSANKAYMGSHCFMQTTLQLEMWALLVLFVGFQ
jgi:hypothetical protein